MRFVTTDIPLGDAAGSSSKPLSKTKHRRTQVNGLYLLLPRQPQGFGKQIPVNQIATGRTENPEGEGKMKLLESKRDCHKFCISRLFQTNLTAKVSGRCQGKLGCGVSQSRAIMACAHTTEASAIPSHKDKKTHDHREPQEWDNV